jgi:hypothetical protein
MCAGAVEAQPMKATPRGLFSGRQSRSRQLMDETRSTWMRAVATGVLSSRWISSSVVYRSPFRMRPLDL